MSFFSFIPTATATAASEDSTRPPNRPMGASRSNQPPWGPPRKGGERPRFGDRKGYQSSSGFGGEKGGVPRDYRLDFRSRGGGGHGFGRGGGGGFNSGGSGGPGAIIE